MENASKALLIAASVLIVILLIAFGMRIFNSTSGSADDIQTTMNATEIATFNGKFTQYIGTKNKSKVVSLLNTVIASNATNGVHKVQINSSDDIVTKMNNLVEGNYKVEIDSTCYTAGFITNIKITNNSSGAAI